MEHFYMVNTMTLGSPPFSVLQFNFDHLLDSSSFKVD